MSDGWASMGPELLLCMEKDGIYIFRVLWRKAFWEPYCESDMLGSQRSCSESAGLENGAQQQLATCFITISQP